MRHGTLAIVPARGGSKRIPRKNIRPFLGVPILARVLGELRAAACFDEIMVSTDDAEIAALARAHGAQVPFMRSAAASSDHASTAEVLLEVIDGYRRAQREFELICCAYPTAVFATAALLREGLEKLRAGGADSLIPVVRYGFPIQRAFRLQDGRLQMWQPQHLRSRSQDLEPAYHDAGQFYWLRTARFLEAREIFTANSLPLMVDELHAQDIDTEADWRAAEFKFEWLKRSGGR